MGRRVVYGNSFSENGWPIVDQDSCKWIVVPGTNPQVNLQIQDGPPLILLRAWAADWNAYIEPLRDADSACWTPTNSVSTSNHLGGTAIDLNWESHPFRRRGSLNAAQMAALEEMEDFYEDNVFWAGRWDEPADEMHSQVGYNTYDRANDRPEPKVLDFIKRKIRADGYSTFRRGSAQMPDDAANVLCDAVGVEDLGWATGLLPAIRDGLLASECTTVPRIAMWLAQVGHESVNFNATEEYDNGANHGDPGEVSDRWKYKGRTWIQITWSSNYADFGEWCFSRGLVPEPGWFVNNPKSLADLKWAGLGAAWYWTVQRPNINAMCDNGDMLGVTRAINGGTNGIADRNARYKRARDLGDRLLVLLGSGEGDDDMAKVPQDQWDRVFLEMTQEHESTSGYRTPGEGKIGTWCTIDRNKDRMLHHLYVEDSAINYGEFDAIERIIRSAKGLGADTSPEFIRRAQNALRRLEAQNQTALTAYLKSKGVIA